MPRNLPFAMLVCVLASLAQAEESVTYRADFATDGLRDWVVEQQPGGTVAIERPPANVRNKDNDSAAEAAMLITDVAGCTVWFKPELHAPLRIRYQIVVTSAGRVSDMNCFWMARDPDHPDDLFAAGHGRTGQFATYDQLQLYYVGYGGNTNSTTRFRRYDGTGARPLTPEHDLTRPEFLLVPDHVYTLELAVTADGHVSYTRDGEQIFAIHDPVPLTRGWFGFRTVNSTTRVLSFEIEQRKATGISESR